VTIQILRGTFLELFWPSLCDAYLPEKSKIWRIYNFLGKHPLNQKSYQIFVLSLVVQFQPFFVSNWPFCLSFIAAFIASNWSHLAKTCLLQFLIMDVRFYCYVRVKKYSSMLPDKMLFQLILLVQITAQVD